MDRNRFEDILEKALNSLPDEFRERIENVDIVVEDWPTLGQLAKVGLRQRAQLLGLYEGVPLVARGSHYGGVLPDKISIFQKPIEGICRSDEEIKHEIRDVLYHEIAHHFGISDERLKDLENMKSQENNL